MHFFCNERGHNKLLSMDGDEERAERFAAKPRECAEATEDDVVQTLSETKCRVPKEPVAGAKRVKSKFRSHKEPVALESRACPQSLEQLVD